MATFPALREEPYDLCMQLSCKNTATYLSTQRHRQEFNPCDKRTLMNTEKTLELKNSEEFLRLSNLPSLVPRETLFVDEDTEQFRNTQCGVSVIHLNGHLRREVVPVDFTTRPVLETSNDILNRS